MDILKHPLPIKSLIFFKLNCHAKMAPDIGIRMSAIRTNGVLPDLFRSVDYSEGAAALGVLVTWLVFGPVRVGNAA
jgi:hypothetical protein